MIDVRKELVAVVERAQSALDAYDEVNEVRISTHGMFDMFLFKHYDQKSIEGITEQWLYDINNPNMGRIGGKDPVDMGPPDLCPAIVLVGDKEVRSVGPMVHARRKGEYDKDQLAEYIKALEDDPDIVRVLAERES